MIKIKEKTFNKLAYLIDLINDELDDQYAYARLRSHIRQLYKLIGEIE